MLGWGVMAMDLASVVSIVTVVSVVSVATQHTPRGATCCSGNKGASSLIVAACGGQGRGGAGRGRRAAGFHRRVPHHN